MLPREWSTQQCNNNVTSWHTSWIHGCALFSFARLALSMAPDNGETSHMSNPAPSNTTAQQQACRNRILHECLFGQWYSQRMLNLVLDSSYTEILTQVIEQAEFGCIFWEQAETRAGEMELALPAHRTSILPGSDFKGPWPQNLATL